MARFIYTDAAGETSLEPIAVRSAVLVDVDRQWFPLDTDVAEIVTDNRLGQQASEFEFHAYKLFSTKGREKLGNKDRRWEILRSFIMLIGKYRLPVVYAAVSKETIPKDAPIWQRPDAVAFSYCVAETEKWLSEHSSHEGGILIADRTLNEKLLRHWIEGGKLSEAFFPPPRYGSMLEKGTYLKHIADTIHFADSATTWGVQLADCCSFFIKRQLMGLDVGEFFSLIQPQIVARFESF